MIHFFTIFSKTADDTAMGRALRAIGKPYRIFCDDISMRYQSRWQLALVCMPRLLGFAIRNASRSLRSDPPPDAVIVGSDIEVLVLSALRRLLGHHSLVVHGSFIYTRSKSARVERLHHAYYAGVLQNVDVAFVHSRLEVVRYDRLFPNAAGRFVFIPFGTVIEQRSAFIERARQRKRTGPPVLVAAGKSGRDYATLISAIEGLDVSLRIICDYADVLAGLCVDARIEILGHCHGDAYLDELAAADIVIVPLLTGDVSAGQMVLIQAKALGRAIIVTDTPTIRDYATNGVDAVLVPIHDVTAMRKAICAVLGDDALRETLQSGAGESFDRMHRIEVFLARQIEVMMEQGRVG